MCNHEKFKISELLFNKFGKRVGTIICCLKCGCKNKIKIKSLPIGYTGQTTK